MTDVVNNAGVPSVVSFDHNHDYGFNRGWGMGFDLGTYADLVRDINKGAGDTQIAIEKIGAANSLATEKIGAANLLAVEKVGAANNLAVVTSQHSLSMQLAECCCEIKALIAEKACHLEGVVRQLDTDNAKLALSNATAELLAIKYQGNGNGN
jgi:hypothetical protein